MPTRKIKAPNCKKCKYKGIFFAVCTAQAYKSMQAAYATKECYALYEESK